MRLRVDAARSAFTPEMEVYSQIFEVDGGHWEWRTVHWYIPACPWTGGSATGHGIKFSGVKSSLYRILDMYWEDRCRLRQSHTPHCDDHPATGRLEHDEASSVTFPIGFVNRTVARSWLVS